MALVSVHSPGGLLAAQFGVPARHASPSSVPAVLQESRPSLLSLLLGRQPGVGVLSHGTPAQGAAEPRAEKQQLQQRALFVKMKPVCASVPVSRLACPAALS